MMLAYDLVNKVAPCGPLMPNSKIGVSPWDLGMSLSRTAPTNNTKVTRQGGRGTHNLFLFL